MKHILYFLRDFWEAIIALIALAFSILSFWQQRRHNRISVQPQFELQVEVHSGKFIIEISNVGLGSMLVKSFYAKNVKTDETLSMKELNYKYLVDYSINDDHILNLLEQGWMKPGDTIQMIRFVFEKEFDDELYGVICDFSFVCEYEDVYGQKFRSIRRPELMN